MVNDKTKGDVSHRVLYLRESERHEVDENLFYKGVDKHKVEPARLIQHSLSDIPLIRGGEDGGPDEVPDDPYQPRYLFHSGDSLLALTKKHNVSSPVTFPGIFYLPLLGPANYRSNHI